MNVGPISNESRVPSGYRQALIQAPAHVPAPDTLGEYICN